ncbi:MAG: hypothetical protein HQL43_07295 [Alphaproteobacteria bacterium]|nr:hypothetical protein [Alphaproteobacteria bacterium]
METTCPHPARLTALSLFHDGFIPSEEARIAQAASPLAARLGLACAQSRFFDDQAMKTRQSLSALRRQGGTEQEDMLRLERNLAWLRDEGLFWIKKVKAAPESDAQPPEALRQTDRPAIRPAAT